LLLFWFTENHDLNEMEAMIRRKLLGPLLTVLYLNIAFFELPLNFTFSMNENSIIVEDVDSIFSQNIIYPTDLVDIARSVYPRVIVEYADSMLEYEFKSVNVPDVEPRIIVEYADSVFNYKLERPSFLNQPPTCRIKLLKEGIEINEINVSEFFDIYVGDSTDDTGIVQVRFSSDDVQDGIPTGQWTDWYDWDISSEDWDASTKIKRWSFATGGAKEVWAEVKDDAAQTNRTFANIYAISPLPTDRTPPAPIVDLWVVEVTTNSITLAWKSPGDDGNLGIAQEYDMRYSTSPITEANWDSATRIEGEPKPSAAGSTEIFTVTGLSWGTTYYFAIKTADEVPNWSDLSNVASGTTTMVGTTKIPYISCIEPASGAPGIEVVIKGLNFYPSLVGPKVEFGSMPGWPFAEGEVISYTENEIVIKVPNGEGIAEVSVIVDSKESNKVWFTYEKPEIEKISPSSGIPGTIVTIEGRNFGYRGEGPIYNPYSYVKFGKSSAEIVSWEDTKIVARAPSDYGTGINDAKFIAKLLSLALGGEWSTVIDILIDLVVPGASLSPTEDGILEDVQVVTAAGMDKSKFTWKVVSAEASYLESAAELRVYDSQKHVTGLMNGTIYEEIPNSFYYDNGVVIFDPQDSYYYEVVGVNEGTYKLEITSLQDGKNVTFTATEIPVMNATVHQYIIDWSALSVGEEGVTVKVDSDGDGVFECVFSADTNLTQDEFREQTSPVKALPLWIIGLAIAIVAITTVSIAIFLGKRKQHSTKRSSR